jgi:hypothetical protein
VFLEDHARNIGSGVRTVWARPDGAFVQFARKGRFGLMTAREWRRLTAKGTRIWPLPEPTPVAEPVAPQPEPPPAPTPVAPAIVRRPAPAPMRLPTIRRAVRKVVVDPRQGSLFSLP